MQYWRVAHPCAEVDRESGSSTASSEGAAPAMLGPPRESRAVIQWHSQSPIEDQRALNLNA